MIVLLLTLSSRRHDQSNCWRLAPLRSSMWLIHINGLFVVVAQFCALIAINCCCHRRSLSRLNIGHEYGVDDVIVPLSLLASLMRHKRHSPHRCRWGRLRLQDCLVWRACFLSALMPHDDGLNCVHQDRWWRRHSSLQLCLVWTLAHSRLGFRWLLTKQLKGELSSFD